MRAIVVALFAVGVSVPARQQETASLTHSFVLTPKNAYFVAPPRLVMTDEVTGLEFSQDGRYVLINAVSAQSQPGRAALDKLMHPEARAVPRAPQFKVWDTRTDVVRDASPAISRLLAERNHAEDGMMMWTALPGVAIVAQFSGDEKSGKTEFYRVDFTDGSLRVLASVPERAGSFTTVTASPTKPLLVLWSRSTNKPIDRADIKTTLRFSVLDMNGNVKKSGETTIKGSAYLADWTEDGTNAVGHTARRTSSSAKPITSTIVLNTLTGQITETTEKIKIFEDRSQDPPLDDVTVWTSVTVGETKRNMSSLWLRSTEPTKDGQCLVAAGVGDAHWLSPKLDQIAYVSEGRLFASEIVRLDLEAFVKAKAASEMAVAMSNAKQAALATLIYATDYDDVMPLHDGYADSVLPYIKNRDVLDNFVYTYAGGPLKDIKDVSQTELGYISVSGGRCVAYVDGHVKFIKNP